MPETILEVSEESALTPRLLLGMQDVYWYCIHSWNIGQGGLAGIYAIQQAMGVDVDQEVTPINKWWVGFKEDLEDEVASENPEATSEETDALTNGLLADIKNEVAKLAQQNNGEVADGEARDIVINIVNNYDLNLSDATIQRLTDFAKQV